MDVIKENFSSFFQENKIRLSVILVSFLLSICGYTIATLRFEGEYIHRHQWITTFADYKKQLRESAYPTTPVLLIAGDSTPLFGVDAKTLSEKLNKPVINYGLGAASGLSTILNETFYSVRSGDEVILIVSDRLLAENSELYLNQALVNILDSEEMTAATWLQQIQSLLFAPWDIILFGFDGADDDSHFMEVYQTQSLGEFGDMNAEVLASNNPPTLPNKITRAYPVSESAIERLNQFKNQLHAKGVKFSLLLSPRMKGYTDRDNYQNVIYANIESLRSAGLTVLTSQNDLPDICFDKKYLYDFDTHLNTSGRDIFTHYIANKLLQQAHKTCCS
ncbi:hypothetical protein [Alteromonas sp. BZK5]|uniref:hypothetical protein n=1 Tax=Alteromonas sp. BZK5 TaxID=1904459 RepID=UPI0016538016|nr:hypothetical protein [Alteromonas sp. BZK5]MBC6987765.1 hypothetical protein [Alteromonas sp. BZK5]